MKRLRTQEELDHALTQFGYLVNRYSASGMHVVHFLPRKGTCTRAMNINPTNRKDFTREVLDLLTLGKMGKEWKVCKHCYESSTEGLREAVDNVATI